MINKKIYQQLIQDTQSYKAKLIAVSKTKPLGDIKDFLNMGQFDFGENYVQELVEKQQHFNSSPYWHFIGHLQTNKVKYIAPWIHLIQSVDSIKLLKEINLYATKNQRIIPCLLQVHIAQEESKFGFTIQILEKEISNICPEKFPNIRIEGLMGISTFTKNTIRIRQEYKKLKVFFDQLQSYKNKILNFNTLSMGMSNDYQIALEEGSNMIRIGSLLFGSR
ncbi:MAG: YggS family pyridoxal phosphate-dependent enzyme [Chitinophagaceae bacterium]